MRFARTHRQGDPGGPATASKGRGGALPRAQRVVAYLLLALVMGSVAAMSWSGTYGWAVNELHWTHTHAVLVPIALDIAAMACAMLALDAITDGENGTTFRLLAALFVALSAFTNWRNALISGELAQEVFFPSMSVLAYGLAHAVFERIRRKTKRAQQQEGDTVRRAVKPLPRLGLLPWLPLVGSPRRALGAVREAVAERLPESAPATGETAHRDIPATYVLEGLTQADAIRRAIEAVGPTAREVVAWLAENGWPDVAPQRVYDVIRRDQVRAVGTGEQPVLQEDSA
jgi:hypothetical protein